MGSGLSRASAGLPGGARDPSLAIASTPCTSKRRRCRILRLPAPAPREPTWRSSTTGKRHPRPFSPFPRRRLLEASSRRERSCGTRKQFSCPARVATCWVVFSTSRPFSYHERNRSLETRKLSLPEAQDSPPRQRVDGNTCRDPAGEIADDPHRAHGTGECSKCAPQSELTVNQLMERAIKIGGEGSAKHHVEIIAVDVVRRWASRTSYSGTDIHGS